MRETTWTSADERSAPGQPMRALARAWARWVTAPLHRALDSALRAGELRELDADTLADIGYRKG